MRYLAITWLGCNAFFWAVMSMAADSANPSPLELLHSPDEAVRLQAIDTLGTSGAKNQETLSALIARLQDRSPKVRVRAADALGRIGPAAETAGPALGDLLDDPNVHVRRAAIRSLRSTRPPAQVIVPLLAKAADDADPAVRVSALDGLADSGKAAVPYLIAAIGNQRTAYWACLALGEIGPDAAPAVPAVMQVLAKDPRAEVRREAAMTLGAIGPAAASAVPVLTRSLEDREYGVRMGAVFALGRIGPAAASAEKALHRVEAGNSPPVLRTVTIWALASIHPENKLATRRAVLLLADAMRSKEPRVRATAVRGLASLRAAPELVVPAMTRILEEGPAELRNDALDVLGNVGEPAVPALIVALRQNDVRTRAAMLLGRLGPSAKAAAGALTEVAAKGDSSVRREAFLALGAIGPDARAAVPAATKALHDPDVNVRYSACFALGKMDDAAMDAKPVLQRELDGTDPFLSLAAAWALARIDPDCSQTAAKSLPLLIHALRDPEPLVRLEAATSLRCLGTEAKPAVDTLKKVAKDDANDFVRDMAAEALQAIGD